MHAYKIHTCSPYIHPMSACINGTYTSSIVSGLLQSLCGRLATIFTEQPDGALTVPLVCNSHFLHKITS